MNKNALHFAMRMGYFEIVKCLVDNGIDINPFVSIINFIIFD
jgi:ankyrin repeat protein